MWKYPNHLKLSCSIPQFKGTVPGRFNPYTVDDRFLQLDCSCGSHHFDVFLNEGPCANAKCVACGVDYVLYDVRIYPTGTAYDRANEEYKKWIPAADSGPFRLCVSYEYPEDAESADDISWFVLIAKSDSTGKIYEVMNDETN